MPFRFLAPVPTTLQKTSKNKPCCYDYCIFLLTYLTRFVLLGLLLLSGNKKGQETHPLSRALPSLNGMGGCLLCPSCNCPKEDFLTGASVNPVPADCRKRFFAQSKDKKKQCPIPLACTEESWTPPLNTNFGHFIPRSIQLHKAPRHILFFRILSLPLLPPLKIY